MTFEIVNPAIETYLETLLPDRGPWLLEMEEIARKNKFPAVGPLVGRLLEMLARSINARRIMELGSGFGYSGLWFARALPDDGFLLLSDFDDSNRDLAKKYFQMAEKSHLMQFQVEDGLSLLNKDAEPFDIIFNDIDKEFYPQTIVPAHKRLRPGGLFITDNTLWDGKVTETDEQIIDEPTAAVKEFNKRLKEFSGFVTTWLPLRDGLSVSVKI